MAAIAARRALGDAGLGWERDRLRRRRLGRRRQRRHVGVRARPHRPPVHQRQERLRHRRLGARPRRTRCSPRARPRPRSWSASTSTRRGAFNPLPEEWGLGSWYGETGLMLTTQFFAMKIQRYMAEHGISESTLAKVARQGVRERLAQPERLAPPAAQRGGDPGLQDGQRPADASTCSARPARARSRSCSRAAERRASSRARRCTCARSRSARAASARSRCSARRSRSSRRHRRRPRPRPRRSSRRASGPRTSTSPSSRTPSPAPRSCTSPRPACASTASRRR